MGTTVGVTAVYSLNSMGPTRRHRHGRPRRLPREDPRAEVGVFGDFPVQLATSRTRTTILADLSADSTDRRAFPREDPREVVL